MSLPLQTESGDELTAEIDSHITKPLLVLVADPGVTQHPAGSSFDLAFTITNAETDDDIYLLTATSNVTWGDLSSVPSTLGLHAGASAQITIHGAVPLDAPPGSEGNFEIIATSTTSSFILDEGHAVVRSIAPQGQLQTVTFTGAPSSAAYQSTFTVSSTTNASTEAVITASGACSITGNTVTMTSGSGTCSLTANWDADSSYSAASSTQLTVASKIPPVISWAAPLAITYGALLTGTQLNATANAEGTFVYNPAAGALLGAGSYVLRATFTPTDATDYSTADAQVALQVNQATPTLAWTPASLQLGYSLGASQLNATASVPGTFAYTPPFGTVITTSSQKLSVVFTPTDTSNYTTTSMSVPLTVTPGILASVSPSSIDFGTVYLGTITSKKATVTNLGNAPMTITDPLISIVKGGNSSEYVAVNLCPKSLAAGKSCTISVSFVAGPFYNQQTAILSIKDSAPRNPQTVNLTATVINPQAQLSATSLSFGAQKVNTSSTAKAVTLTNTGATALTISSIAISGTNLGSFSETNNCPSSLAAKSTCTIALKFKPMSKGSRLASVVITDNAQSSPQKISLSGTGN